MKYIFVPSCGILPNNKIDAFTEKRLQEALPNWESGEFDGIIVSGGVFTSGQTIPAGTLMKRWLVGHGVPADKILVEAESLDTYQNIDMSLKMIDWLDRNPEITVVTHWQHCLRFRMTFWRKYGMKIKTIPMFYPIGPIGFIGEWIFLLVHLLDKDGNGFFQKLNRQHRNQTNKEKSCLKK